MANLQQTTKPGFRHKNSCPDGWLHAGAKVPIRLTVRQEEYCRQAIDIHRFCYNLAVRTHRFCRRNRLLWPSWMDISKAFNACKREDYPFVTQVAAVVATGAFRDFGQAVDNWRNPNLRARAPRTKRRTFTGTGSFLAAGSMKEIRYDGKRRVKLPCLGSVKLGCTLPKGICYEASIRRENGRWYICLKLWKPPEPKPERARRPGGIDTGHQPPGHRLRRSDLPESQSILRSAEKPPKVAAGPGPETEGFPGLVGSPAEDRQVSAAHPGTETQRAAPDDQHCYQEVQRAGHRGPERGGNDAGQYPEGAGRCRDGRHQAAADLQGPVAPHPGDPRPHVVSQQQDLQRLRDHQPEAEAGTNLDLRHMRHPA